MTELNEKNRKRPLHMRAFGALIRVPGWIGIRTELLILEREGKVPAEFDGGGGFEFRFLSPDDIDELVRLEPDTTREYPEEMFESGKLCFGAWEGERLVAKMWCDLDEIYHPVAPRKLGPDEVYLQLAYVDPALRGRNLAPSLRVAGYAALRELGRTRFYSYSRYFNTAARRFKQKLGSVSECLIVHVRLFNRWSWSIDIPNR
jgi:ribosomal protein S18 acetylase RimI-like enzyme